MADGAWIGDQHTNVGRLGAPHEMYSALPRTAAAYLTLCNGRLTAQECLQQAIVNKVVPAEQLMAAAEQLAENRDSLGRISLPLRRDDRPVLTPPRPPILRRRTARQYIDARRGRGN